MTFDEVLAQIIDLLKRQGRASYGALKRRFDLDDDYLNDLKDELLYVHPVRDDEGKGLIWRRSPNSLMITGSKPCGICGTRAWANTGVGPTPSRGCVCDDGLRKIMTGSGLQQPGSTTFRSIRRSSTSPSTLPIL